MNPPAERAPLPADPAALPAMGADFETALDEVLAALELTDADAAGPAARASYEAHARLLTAWGAAINLTAIRDPAAVATRHVGDALTATVPIGERISAGASLLDLGSGGGYPGLPLAAALPLGRVGLLDSVGKKVRFLIVAGAAVAAALADGERPPVRIEAIAERAEDIAEDPDERARWAVVTARAIGPLAEVMELGLPLAAEGGHVVAWKRDQGGGLSDELRDAGPIIRRAGGGRPDVLRPPAAVFADHRLVIVRKERPTPSTYPRSPTMRRGSRR